MTPTQCPVHPFKGRKRLVATALVALLAAAAPLRPDEKISLYIGLILCGLRSLPAKEHAILELLASDGPMFGLQIVERAGGALKRGTVYVTLGRMEAKGLVRSEEQPLPPGGIGLPRRVYHVTALGERMLRAWTAFAHELAWEMKP
jgi:hypothetical protein